MSRTEIDNYLWNVRLYLMKVHGTDAANKDVAPLEWYINTGRASAEFLKRLFQVRPFLRARILHNGGSYDDAIRRIKSRIGFDNV